MSFAFIFNVKRLQFRSFAATPKRLNRAQYILANTCTGYKGAYVVTHQSYYQPSWAYFMVKLSEFYCFSFCILLGR